MDGTIIFAVVIIIIITLSIGCVVSWLLGFRAGWYAMAEKLKPYVVDKPD